MRVFYDGEIFRLQRAGGVNRIFAELISRLPPDFQPTLGVGRRADGAQFPRHPRLRLLRLKKTGGLLSLARTAVDRTRLALSAGLARFDIVHPTYYTQLARRAPRSFGRRVVVTVYDMIHERFPALLDPGGALARAKAAAVAAADLVICISEATRADLLERLPIAPERVRVIRLAGLLPATPATPATPAGPAPAPLPDRPYLLHVGSRAPYKNFDGLLRALALLGPRARDLALAVTGAPLEPAERALVASLGLEGRVEALGVVPDARLSRLYAGALALAYPSRHEGFGIPPLEAMSLGTPVVALRTSSIPEVVGDAGLLCEPGSDEALAAAIRRVLEEPSLRADLAARGRARAGLFSWDRMARETVEAYRELAR